MVARRPGRRVKVSTDSIPAAAQRKPNGSGHTQISCSAKAAKAAEPEMALN
jgi:hypothetical protein